MLGYTIKRLLQMVLVLFCVSVIVFLMMSFTGDPVFMVIPIDSTTAEIEQARRLLGLDRSLLSQYFIFLGNMLPMTAVVGQLYIDAPLRLCNAYLLDDQARLGQWLIGLAALLALGWLAQVGWWMARREGAALLPHEA